MHVLGHRYRSEYKNVFKTEKNTSYGQKLNSRINSSKINN